MSIEDDFLKNRQKARLSRSQATESGFVCSATAFGIIATAMAAAGHGRYIEKDTGVPDVSENEPHYSVSETFPIPVESIIIGGSSTRGLVAHRHVCSPRDVRKAKE